MGMSDRITCHFKRVSDDKTAKIDKNVAKWYSFEEMCNIVNSNLAHDKSIYVVRDFWGHISVHLDRRIAIMRYVIRLIDKIYTYNKRDSILYCWWDEETYDCFDCFKNEVLHGDSIVDKDNTILYNYLYHCSDTVNKKYCIVGVNDNDILYDGHKLLNGSNDCKDNNVDLSSWGDAFIDCGVVMMQ